MSDDRQHLWIAYVQIFRTAVRMRDYSYAEHVLDSALHDAEIHRDVDSQIVWAVHSLASLYHSFGRTTDARRLLQRLIKLADIVGAEDPSTRERLRRLDEKTREVCLLPYVA